MSVGALTEIIMLGIYSQHNGVPHYRLAENGKIYTLLHHSCKNNYSDFLVFVPINYPRIDRISKNFFEKTGKSGGKTAKEDYIMKKFIPLLLAAIFAMVGMTGCSEKTLLSPNDPVTLTMWHVYGEQADSPMNVLVEEFNRTVGQEKGIIINVTNITGTSKSHSSSLMRKRVSRGRMRCLIFSPVTP